MMHITEDTPPDMLAGAMDLTVHLPSGKTVKMPVERSTPMLDVLVLITTRYNLQVSGYCIEALGMAPSQDYSDKILAYRPNTPLGALDTQHIRVIPKPKAVPAPKPVLPPGHQPFESTFRLKVHLPKNQLYVIRVTRNIYLENIMEKVCDDKNLDARKYEFRHPGNLDEVLDPKLTISDYQITEIYIVAKGTATLTAFSTNDIMALRREEEKKQMHVKSGGGVFNLIFKRGKNSLGSGSVSSENRSISPTHSDDSRSVTPPAITPQLLATPNQSITTTLPPANLVDKPKAPLRKRKPAAPKPPQPKPPEIIQNTNQVESKLTNEVKLHNDASSITQITPNNQTHLNNNQTLLNNNQTHLINNQVHLNNNQVHLNNNQALLNKNPAHLNNNPGHLKSNNPTSLINEVTVTTKAISSEVATTAKREESALSNTKKVELASTLISHSRTSSDSSGYHEASILSDNANTSLPRRPKAMMACQEVPETSKSTSNLSAMAGKSKSTTSLVIAGRRKKAAPAPPMPVKQSPTPPSSEITLARQEISSTVTMPSTMAISSSVLDQPAKKPQVELASQIIQEIPTKQQEDIIQIQTTKPKPPKVAPRIRAPVPKPRPRSYIETSTSTIITKKMETPNSVKISPEEKIGGRIEVLELGEHGETVNRGLLEQIEARQKLVESKEEEEEEEDFGEDLVRCNAINPNILEISNSLEQRLETIVSDDLESLEIKTQVQTTTKTRSEDNYKKALESINDVDLFSNKKDTRNNFDILRDMHNNAATNNKKSKTYETNSSVSSKGSSKYDTISRKRGFQIGSSLTSLEANSSISSSKSYEAANSCSDTVSLHSSTSTSNQLDEEQDLDDINFTIFNGSVASRKQSKLTKRSSRNVNELFGIHDGGDNFELVSSQSVSSMEGLPGFKGMKKWNNLNSLDGISIQSGGSLNGGSFVIGGDGSDSDSIDKLSETSLPQPESNPSTNLQQEKTDIPKEITPEKETTIIIKPEVLLPENNIDNTATVTEENSTILTEDSRILTENSRILTENSTILTENSTILITKNSNILREKLPSDKILVNPDSEWKYELPLPPTAFRDEDTPESLDNLTNYDTTIVSEKFRGDSVVTSPELFDNHHKVAKSEVDTIDTASEVRSLASIDDKPIFNKLSLESLEKRKSLVYNRELATSLKYSKEDSATWRSSTETLSSKRSSVINELEDVLVNKQPPANVAKKEIRPAKQLFKPVDNSLPNFKITTYDQLEKAKINIYEDDTIRSNASNLQQSSQIMGKSYDSGLDDNSLFRKPVESNKYKSKSLLRKQEGETASGNNGVGRSGSFSMNTWVPMNPIKRSKSQVALYSNKYNGGKNEELREEDYSGTTTMSKAASSMDISGLQSLEVMKMIQTRLQAPLMKTTSENYREEQVSTTMTNNNSNNSSVVNNHTNDISNMTSNNMNSTNNNTNFTNNSSHSNNYNSYSNNYNQSNSYNTSSNYNNSSNNYNNASNSYNNSSNGYNNSSNSYNNSTNNYNNSSSSFNNSANNYNTSNTSYNNSNSFNNTSGNSHNISSISNNTSSNSNNTSTNFSNSNNTSSNISNHPNNTSSNFTSYNNASPTSNNASLTSNNASLTSNNASSTSNNASPISNNASTFKTISSNPNNLTNNTTSTTLNHTKRFSPPDISLGTWTDRPKTDITVKSDLDYSNKFNNSTSYTLPNNNNTRFINDDLKSSNNNNNVSIKVNGGFEPITTHQESGNVTIRIGGGAEDQQSSFSSRFINHTTAVGYRKPLGNVNKIERNPRPHSIAFDGNYHGYNTEDISRRPVVTSATLKKPTMVDFNNRSITQIGASNNDNLYNNNTGNVYLGNRASPIVKGFSSSSNSLGENNRKTWSSFGTLPAKVSSSGKEKDPEREFVNVNVPFSQSTLKRTDSNKIRVSANDISNGFGRVIETPQQVVVNSQNSNKVVSSGVPLPPQLPKAVKILRAAPIVRNQERSNNGDPREALLSAIQNFGGKRGLKGVKS